MRLPTQEQTRFHGARWTWVLGLAVLTYVAFPSTVGEVAPLLEPGAVSDRDIIAPFDFVVNKSDLELQREAEELAASAKPIYQFRQRAYDSAATAMHAFFDAVDAVADRGSDAIVRAAREFQIGLTPAEGNYLRNGSKRDRLENALTQLFDRTLALGVAAPGVLQVEQASDLLIRRRGAEIPMQRDQLMSYQQYLARARTMHPDPGSSVGELVYLKLAGHFFRATLVFDRFETERRRNELRKSVEPAKYLVRAGERIVGAHEVVTAEAHERLVGLHQELQRHGVAVTGAGRAAIGAILRDTLILTVFWVLMVLYRRETYRDPRQVALLGLLFAVTLLGGAGVARLWPQHPELIPLPFMAVMITVLFNGRVSMIAAMIISVVIGLQAVFQDSPALFLCLAGGVTAALSVRSLRRRSHLYGAVLVAGAGYLVAALALGLTRGWGPTDIGFRAALGLFNGLISASLTYLLLPVAERFTQITTDLTLLELSDPSRPLLRRLSLEAPGTYAHSIAMANLVEAASNRIGANGLLGRVGCYYHDVGKLKNPPYFVENQTHGGNPHDRLKAAQSAQIIKAHVLDGLALAREAGLPEVVAAFIPEHHGTTEITYFLDRARKQGDGPTRSADYRYPGPKPRSVETAITMLADSVEAALRVLDDLTPQKIEEAIDHIVRSKIQAGQLDDAPMTLRQIEQVKEEFVRVLSSMHHHRIDYPESSGGLTADWQPPQPPQPPQATQPAGGS